MRDAGLTLTEINELRRAAARARKTGQTPEEFTATNPAVAPIVDLIVQQGRGRDWLVILLMVLAIIVPYVQNAQHDGQDEQQPARSTTPTTLVLSDGEISAIERAVEAKIERNATARPRPTQRPRKRPKRAEKKYGQNKRHR